MGLILLTFEILTKHTPTISYSNLDVIKGLQGILGKKKWGKKWPRPSGQFMIMGSKKSHHNKAAEKS